MQVILRVGLALLIIGDLINHFFIEPAGESHSLGISMANHQTGKLNSIRGDGASRAVIFVHGFSGDRDDTWDDFPLLLGTHLAGWDIFTLGYATTLLPDVAGIWSADPDLPIISAMVRTHFQLDPLSTYESVALVAHSMGGLIVQKALVDDADLPGRTSHVLLFGTPSAGLRKASWLSFLKRQLKNMSKDSPFITELREAWTARFEPEPGFDLWVVAGSQDQFVPPSTSLGPFDARYQHVVPGDHLSIVKPKDAHAASFRLLVAALTAGVEPPPETRDPLALAAERPSEDVDISEVAAARGQNNDLTEADVVDVSLALERAGRRADAIELLEQHSGLGPDIHGTLGGRMKRLWLEEEELPHAERAFEFYGTGLAHAQALLAEARTDKEKGYAHDQVYYHAINRAFFHFVVFDEPDQAKQLAALATQHAKAAGENVWSVATLAEAHLYMGEPEQALTEYRRMMELGDGEPWQHASAGLQATQIASTLEDADLAEHLAVLFTPHTRKVNKIFVSYSHDDQEWVERLQTMAKPWLRAHQELDLWVDTRIQAGELWDQEIKTALAESGVAIALVSATFLASDYISEHEMPQILRAAKDGDLRLLWVYVSYAAVDATTLPDFQATHDVSRPLVALERHEQDAILLDVVHQMKEAALSATVQYTAHEA